jgi:amino acid adenylation domain-containing protein
MLRRKEDELRQRTAWNQTNLEYPRDRCVPQLVAAWAQEAPHNTALVVGNQVMTYAELNRRANQLAHHLQTLGVGPEVRVALCVERSFEMVIGLLGILKAGGAYVPLDPGYPADRLAFLIQDAQAPVLVTQSYLAERLPDTGARTVAFDCDAQLLSQQSTNEPAGCIPGDLAYVIYTSGSTGHPKGVQITHESLVNMVFWHQRAFAVTARDKATQLTSPAFDATGWELWPYLTAGASVSLVDERLRVEASSLRDWLVASEITIAFAPTALAENLLALEWPRATRLRYLLTGADALHTYPPAGLPFQFVNNYGPTEATVLVTSGIIAPQEHPTQAPPLGRPIANTQLYILDEQLQPVPMGEVGEIYIGGVALARGYLNRPALTAEKFIDHPFSTESGARLYKTGDRGRFLPDGQLAFVGRVDHQIKIRGYRIEPGEIVEALNRQPGIQKSYVVAREDIGGDKRLVAYIVLHQEAQISASELRHALLETLPDYMVPATFIRLEDLPYTPNGKVDQAALPAPDATNSLQDAVMALPTTPIEKQLDSIVSALLGIAQVDIDDNFFMLGGHSMLGTQVITRVAETFNIALPLRVLFEAPTIRELAAEVEHRIVEKISAMSEDEVRALL